LGGQFYWQSSTGRQDLWYKAGLGLIAPFFKDWTMSFEAYHFKNNSTVDAATYNKQVVSILFARDFI
jgi:hypothetical protein